MNDSTDEFLVALYASGDERGLSQLAARYGKPLHSFVTKIIRDSHTAEDIVQEVFIAVATTIETLKRPRYFRRWVYRMTYFKTMNVLRHQKNEVPCFTSLEGFIDDAELIDPASLPRPSDKQLMMRELLDRLPGTDRAILELKYIQKFTFREIAEMTDQQADTLRTSVSSLRRALIDRLRSLERGGE